MKIVYKNVRGYWAMNHYAGKQLHLSKKSIPSKNTLYVNKKLKGTERLKHIVGHEKFEIHNLRDRGMKYKKQESYTNKFEKNMGRKK